MLGVATCLTASALAGPESVLKRARETRDQNNVRQAVPSPAQPAQAAQPNKPAMPAVPSAPSSLLLKNLAKVRTDLAAIQANSTLSPGQKLQLTTNLLACAQGPGKPSQATVAALTDSLTAAFVQKPLPDTSRNRLVSDLAAVLNPAKIPPGRMQAIYDDIQAIFQANGMARNDAVKIVDQVKAVGAEIQK